MSTFSKHCIAYLVFMLTFNAAFGGQIRTNKGIDGESLQKRYNDAVELQRTSKLNEAADQYRVFLADALRELAMGYGLAGDDKHSSTFFEQALALDPNDASLLLDYAGSSLISGNTHQALTLATTFLKESSGGPKKTAQAHQILGRALLKLNQNLEAKKEFEEAVALDPTFPNGYDLAVACLDMDDEKCAKKIFAEMEQSFGDTAEIHMTFGRAYGDSDSQSQAIEEFKRAISENPRLPGAHYLLASVLLATSGGEDHVTAAEEELKKELMISPQSSLAYAALGKIAMTRNDYVQAEKYLKDAIARATRSPDAYLYLGQLYFNTNRSAEAEAALRQCIAFTTDVSRNRYQVGKAHFFLGRILMQRGQPDAAHDEMKISRDLENQALSQDKNKLAGLLEIARPDETQGTSDESSVSSASRASIPQAVALDNVKALEEQLRPAVADSYNNLGAIAATNADYTNAVKYFQRSAEWNPTVEGLDYNLARAAFAGSQFQEAIPPLQRYLKLHLDDTGARSVLAISQYMTGDYRGCIDSIEPVIGKKELAPQTEYVFAESMIKTGKLAFGVQRLTALEKLHPEIVEVHRALGEAAVEKGENQHALDELRTAVQLSPQDANSHYDIGKIEINGGDTASAISELEEATRLMPDNEKFHEELAKAYVSAGRPVEAQKEIELSKLIRSRVATGSPSSQVVSHQ